MEGDTPAEQHSRKRPKLSDEPGEGFMVSTVRKVPRIQREKEEAERRRQEQQAKDIEAMAAKGGVVVRLEE